MDNISRASYLNSTVWNVLMGVADGLLIFFVFISQPMVTSFFKFQIWTDSFESFKVVRTVKKDLLSYWINNSTFDIELQLRLIDVFEYRLDLIKIDVLHLFATAGYHLHKSPAYALN